jgi:hypothetical protein
LETAGIEHSLRGLEEVSAVPWEVVVWFAAAPVDREGAARVRRCDGEREEDVRR